MNYTNNIALQIEQLNELISNNVVKAFITQYYPYALMSENESGISAKAVLAQSALETGWGRVIKGNMMFGVKAKASTPLDKKQLLTTTEYLKSANVKFPEVISVTKQANGLYKYVVKDWFMKYNTPKESFDDHAEFLKRNPRYSTALLYKADANKFVEEIAKAGYATDPNYAATLKSIIKTIEKHV